MDSTRTTTPPSHTHRSNPKSATRLARITYSIPPSLSLDLVPSSPNQTPSTPSAQSLKSSTTSLPLQELLLLSPSPSRKPRARLSDRLEMAEDVAPETNASRRRCRSRGNQIGAFGCSSPRSHRRLRRRVEMESREERDLVGLMDEVGKARKTRHSGKSKKEKLSLPTSSFPSSSCIPKVEDSNGGNLDAIGMVIYDLIMWKDVAKSTLWFGLGCLCFLSSCFAKGINFSIFSVISQLGLLFLGASFLSNSICQRNNVEKGREFKLTDEDILQVGRLMLPAMNLTIAKMRELFSGEPSMTLKVTPLLLLGAEYGHLLNLRRICAVGFFFSFTIPKLYSCYSSHINRKVESTKCRLVEAWQACSHKKIVAASAISAFWNLSSIKTRIFAAFISLVILRWCQKQMVTMQQEGEAEQVEQVPNHRALVVAEKH